MGRALHVASVVSIGLALTLAGFAWAPWVLAAGLGSILMLPVLRLAFVMEQLARKGEWRFVLAGAGVLLLLALSLIWPAG